MSAVLVTGATTAVGAAIVSRLLTEQRTSEVLAVGAEPYEAVQSLFPHPGVIYLQADLSHPRELRNLLFSPVKQHRVETVIHTALHRSAHATGRRVHQLNVESTRELLRLCERVPTVRTFVLRSHAELYRQSAPEPELLDERHPIDLSVSAAQWLRDRAEVDLLTCASIGLSSLQIRVLRCADCLAPFTGSQLFDYLQSQLCFQPLGFDPMLNVISLEDLSRAFALAITATGSGVFNIPGKDTLPLSEVIRKWGRTRVPVPSALLSPLYWLRNRTIGTDFRYDLNRFRFHYSAVMNGSRAAEQLHYTPQVPIEWPESGGAVRRSDGLHPT